MKSKSNPFLRTARFVVALTVSFTAIPAHAASLFWDGGTTDIVGTGNAISAGGSGTWDTTIKNWDFTPSGTAYAAWPVASNSNVANFGGAGGTVTLGANLGATGAYPNSINITAGNYVIDQAGFDLSFRGTGIMVSAGATLDITNGTITLQNNGTLSVTGLNGFKIHSKISDSTGITLSKGGAGDLLLYNDSNDFTGNLYGANGGGSGIYITSIKNSGIASAAGAGSIVETGFNNSIVYTGTGDSTNRTFSLVGGGDDTLKNNGSTGALIWTGAFANTKPASSTLRFSGTNTAANDFQGNLVNSGANILTVIKEDAGTWIFSGANTYTGTTTIAAGILQANQADVAAVSSALGNGGVIRFTGGTLQYGANSAATDYSTRINNNTTAAIKLDTNGQNVTFGSVLASTNTAGLTKEGAGQLDLKMSAAVQYTGTTTINGGTLKFTMTTAEFEGVSSPNININNGSTLVVFSNFGGTNRTTFNNNKTFTFGSTGGGAIRYDSGNHLWQSITSKFETTGGSQNAISSANGGFINPQNTNTVNFDVADGTDAVDLLVSVQITSGNYTKSGVGTLSITSSSTLGGGGAQPNLTINAGTFDVGSSARLTTAGQITGVVTSDILNNGVYLHSSSGAQTLSGVISGTGALTQNGSGTVTLTGTNSYTGATLVSSNTLLVNGNQSTATGIVTVDAAGTLGGTGSLGGATTVNGSLAPGNNAVGMLNFTTGGLTLGSLAENSLKFQLGASTTAGTTYDTVATNALNIGTLDFADFQFTDTGTLAAGVYTLISSGSAITGTIGTATGTIGAFSGTLSISGNNLILTVSGGGNPYTTWAGGAAFDADANNDGVDNGLAWILGAANPGANALGLLPVPGQSSGNLTMTFTQVNPMAPARLFVEYSKDLGFSDPWHSVEVPTSSSTVLDVIFTVTPGSPSSNVTLTVPASKAAAGKLFGRLRGAEN